MNKIKKSFSVSWVDRAALLIAFILLAIAFARVHNQNIDLQNRIKQEAKTRKENREAFVESRYRDCQRENKLRIALIVNVKQGQRNIPLLLKLLPQLDSKEILEINKKSVEYQIKQFSPLNCEEYAEEAIHEK